MVKIPFSSARAASLLKYLSLTLLRLWNHKHAIMSKNIRDLPEEKYTLCSEHIGLLKAYLKFPNFGLFLVSH
jgi:hypothetical protein